MKVGDAVVFVDSLGRPQPALVTTIWGNPEDKPCINVVVCSLDDSRTDGYGRQIERHSSVVYRTSNPAHGYYYAFVGEPLNPVAEAQK